MPWRESIISNLPTPRDGEPAGLRQDILDELADHLECAASRELRRVEDPQQARRNVLERFGNPQSIARQLWLDAMKEQLMTQRIMIGTQLLTVAAVIVLCIVAVVALRQNQRVQESLLARLSAAPAAVNDPVAFNWPTFKMRVASAGNDAGVAQLHARLEGEPYRDGEKAQLSATTDANGNAAFGPLRPGVYSLSIGSNDQVPARYSVSVTVPPGVQQPKVIQWPQPPHHRVMKGVNSNVPPSPEDFEHLVVISVRKSLFDRVGGGIWRHESVMIAIDPQNRVAILPPNHPFAGQHFNSTVPDSEIPPLEWTGEIEFDASWTHRAAHAMYWIARAKPQENREWVGHQIGELQNLGNLNFDQDVIDLSLPQQTLNALARTLDRTVDSSHPGQ